MSWMRKLYDTYEQAQTLGSDDDEVLMPISHTLQNAHIKINIDDRGNFLSARPLEKTQIILPATEKSAGRSSGEAPHPLADKLQYVAKDYARFGGKKKHYFDGYLGQLSDWADSDFSHPSVQAIREYVKRGTVIADLVAAHVCHLDQAGCLLTCWEGESEVPDLLKLLPKDKGEFDQGNALVCWSVEIPGQISETWLDKSLQEAWINYEIERGGDPAFCFIAGEESQIATNHPAKLRHSGDKAKLISANDSSGYTFRGRFFDNSQAAEVGFEVTQKAHNALRWLISRQGFSSFNNGDQVILAWAVSGNRIPHPMSDLESYDSEDNGLLFSLEDDVVDHSVDLGRSFAAIFNQKLRGKRSLEALDVTDDIVVMAIDSATPGRMAISYFRDFRPEEYLNNLSQWHYDFAWWQRASKEKQTQGKPSWYLSAPTLWTILQTVYGDIIKSNEALKKNLVERLLPSIVDRRSIPKDIVERAFHRAVARQSFKHNENWQWEQNLGVACALIRGGYARNQKRRIDMALDTETNSRDYLFGRLLAIAERIEEEALRASGNDRPTASQRLMQRFADRPYETWLLIYKQLDPYFRQLKQTKAGFLTFISRELDEVMDKFDTSDYKRQKSLSPEFLLGFHSQRMALRQNKESKENQDNIEEGIEA